jgi:hypothetical protein
MARTQALMAPEKGSTVAMTDQVLILLRARPAGLRLSLLGELCRQRYGNTRKNGQAAIGAGVARALGQLARKGLVEQDSEDPERWRLV